MPASTFASFFFFFVFAAAGAAFFEAAFFDAFFAGRSGRAFLTGRDDLPGTLAGMTGVFRAATPRIKAHMLRSAASFHSIGR